MTNRFDLTDEEVEELAPSNLDWHELYARTMQGFYPALQPLLDHPAFADAEDLGDYVEALQTMLGFRPSTHPNINRAVKEMLDSTIDPYGVAEDEIRRAITKALRHDGAMNDMELGTLLSILKAMS